MDSTIRLFKALPINNKTSTIPRNTLIEKTIKYGFVFSPEVIANYPEKELEMLIGKTSVGLSPEQLNASFHKSWKKIKEANIEQLVFEQILHYFTTYGAESLGLYHADSVYIPNEELNVPELDKEKLSLVVIKGYTKEELKVKLLELLESGVALADKTKDDVIDVATYVGVTSEEICNTKNKEVRVALFDYFGFVPSNPTEFLRYLVYKTTNQTLLIKNPKMINEIKERDCLSALGLLEKYSRDNGLEGLASIFYRFKPIFLAFRKNRKLKTLINKIRKLAVIHHKPMAEDYLNTITGRIKNDVPISVDKLKKELAKANNFRKIRLAYALNYRANPTDSILYRIRNGKGYATDFNFTKYSVAEKMLGHVVDSLCEDIKKNVEGKTVYIPDNINYALPSTEKMFTGEFPSGTYVSVPNDMIFGIHWKNVKGHRIDLDLSLLSINRGKIGWDSSYRTRARDILFSGDVTDAPNGASELFYVKRQVNEVAVLMVNYFNFNEAVDVPFQILVAQEKTDKLSNNYTVDPNNVTCVSNTSIDKRQKMLGMLVTTENECRFYFSEVSLGMSITSSYNEYTKHAREFFINTNKNNIMLKDVLSKAGAIITQDKENCDIDLSPESLEKDTILKLLY